jgi:hypothetical protein
MHRHDVCALNKALAAYKKISPQARAEASALQLQHGWRAAAIYAARKCQAIAAMRRASSRVSNLPRRGTCFRGSEIRSAWFVGPLARL